MQYSSNKPLGDNNLFSMTDKAQYHARPVHVTRRAHELIELIFTASTHKNYHYQCVSILPGACFLPKLCPALEFEEYDLEQHQEIPKSNSICT